MPGTAPELSPAEQSSRSHPAPRTRRPQAEGGRSQRALRALFFPQFQSFPCWPHPCLFNEPIMHRGLWLKEVTWALVGGEGDRLVGPGLGRGTQNPGWAILLSGAALLGQWELLDDWGP